MSSSPQEPHISLDLIEWLSGVFPEQAPSRSESFEDLKWRGGQVFVVQWLKARYAAQQQEAMDNDQSIRGIQGNTNHV